MRQTPLENQTNRVAFAFQNDILKLYFYFVLLSFFVFINKQRPAQLQLWRVKKQIRTD